jgi:hypothetical protein
MKDEKQLSNENMIAQILDGTADTLVLYDEEDNEVTFEWVATIPYDIKDEKDQAVETRIYCILKPVQKVQGVDDDEAIVFRVYEQSVEGIDDIEVEENFEIAEAVFQKYNDYCEE